MQFSSTIFQHGILRSWVWSWPRFDSFIKCGILLLMDEQCLRCLKCSMRCEAYMHLVHCEDREWRGTGSPEQGGLKSYISCLRLDLQRCYKECYKNRYLHLEHHGLGCTSMIQYSKRDEVDAMVPPSRAIDKKAEGYDVNIPLLDCHFGEEIFGWKWWFCCWLFVKTIDWWICLGFHVGKKFVVMDLRFDIDKFNNGTDMLI